MLNFHAEIPAIEARIRQAVGELPPILAADQDHIYELLAWVIITGSSQTHQVHGGLAFFDDRDGHTEDENATASQIFRLVRQEGMALRQRGGMQPHVRWPEAEQYYKGIRATHV